MSFVLWSLWFLGVLLALRLAARKLTCLPAAKLLLLPGALAAIATRGAAALAARTEIKAVRLPWQPGEGVQCDRPKVPVLGRLFLGAVPVAAAVTAILAARQYLAPPPWFEAPLPDMEVSLDAFRTFAGGAAGLFTEAAALAQRPEFRSWRVAVLLYLAVSLLIFTAPDPREWQALALCLLPAGLFFAAIRFLELEAGLFTRGWYIEKYYVPVAAEALVFLLAMALVALLSVLVLELARRAAVRGREPEARPEGAKKRRAAVEA